MAQDQQPTVYTALLEGLRRAAVDTYGEERAAEAPFQTALEVAATNVMRVMQEPLHPFDAEPYRV
jgi:hypothetical protein